MTAIGPGDWVECVNDAADHYAGQHIAKGAILCVQEVEQTAGGFSLCPECGLDDRGITFQGEEPIEVAAWCPCSFRPIYTPKSELLRDLLQPIKADAEPLKVTQSASGEGLLWLPDGVETFPTVDAAWAALTALSELPQALKLKEQSR